MNVVLPDRVSRSGICDSKCVCLSVWDVMYCDVTVHPRAKVTIDSLQEVVLNDFDLCLEVTSGHVNILCHSVGHISALAEFLVHYFIKKCEKIRPKMG